MDASTDPIIENHSDRRGAERLKARLEHFWHSRGHRNVEFRIVAANFKKFALYQIRSNLINGLPPRIAPHRADPTMERISGYSERGRLKEFLPHREEAA